MNHLTLVPVEEHSVAHGAEVGALAGDPGLEAHLVLLQVDGDGGGHRGRGRGRHLDWWTDDECCAWGVSDRGGRLADLFLI